VSYILDALRRADAERERGSVPSLHAQSVLPGSPDAGARRNGRSMAWVVAALAIALAASLGWHLMSRDAVREVSTVVPAQTAATDPAPAPAPAQPSPQAPTRAARPAALPPVPAARPVPAPVTTAPLAKTQPGTSPSTTAATPAASAAPVTASPAPPANTAAPPAPAANTRIPRQEELPEDIRRQLPKFSVGGSIYSESAASRFLILNGQIFHENDKVMPDLVLEQIKLKSAVLRYRDQRFTIAY